MDDDGSGFLIYTSLAEAHSISIAPLNPAFTQSLPEHNTAFLPGTNLDEVYESIKRHESWSTSTGIPLGWTNVKAELSKLTEELEAARLLAKNEAEKDRLASKEEE